ncbi:hypothetical protein GUJ93_ZPchr0012g20866 [Zizania palustris]|uniref:Uncharacterized protein n=1 Tax=Zizania palustris TaxID=103762 RepID=A0A8J5WLT0_ZIZPA|nr:hypothetical protein GUJ93_ZPchr0012g20866 [Zizania palustris]
MVAEPSPRKGEEEEKEKVVLAGGGSPAMEATAAAPAAGKKRRGEEEPKALIPYDQSSPVANEWSIKKRFELAGLLSSILRARLQAYDPILSMALRYLISIHKVLCSRQGFLRLYLI